MKGVYTNGYEQMYCGEEMEVEKEGVHLACCGCGMVHFVKPKIRQGRVFLRINRDEAETLKLRKKQHGTIWRFVKLIRGATMEQTAKA